MCTSQAYRISTLVKWFNLLWMWGPCGAGNLSALKMHRLFEKYKITR